jgi:CRP/FNR family transcriptional regulator, cyclic AMP receptor protein
LTGIIELLLCWVGSRTIFAQYGDGELIFVQGDPADAVFYVQDGKVKLSVVSRQGKEAVVGAFSTNDFFGEGS